MLKDHAALKILGCILLILFIAGAIWWLNASFQTITVTTPPVKNVPAQQAQVQEVPGNSLTLGENSTAALGKFLIGYNGMTLYTFSQDSAGKSLCVGACATTWIPYVVTATSSLVAEYPVTGTIGTTTRADGSVQVTYNGQPLYFYSGDRTTDDTQGVGVSPDWSIAKP